MKFKRKDKVKKEPRFRDMYDQEEYRLRKTLAEMDPYDEEYDKMQQRLKNNIQMKADSRESRRKICKSDRGGIIIKVLSIAGALGGAFMIGKFETDGMTYTGEKRSFMDALTRTFGNMFLSGRK